MPTHRSYLCAPAYSHGSLRPIEEIAELQSDASLAETLRALGLDTYSEVRGSIDDLAQQSIAQTLHDAELPAAAVDAIIYASSLYTQGPHRHAPADPGRFLGRLIERSGMHRAHPYGVSFAQCVNIVGAIELAQSLLSSGLDHVLVLTADIISPSFSRLVEPGVSVTSDVASSALVTTDPRGRSRFAINTIQKWVDWKLINLDPREDFAAYLRRTVDGMRVTSGKIYESERASPASFAQLITNTINRSVVRIFSQATSVPPARVYQGNVSRLAHCDAADILINLADYTASTGQLADQRLLLLANGPYLWGGISATAC